MKFKKTKFEAAFSDGILEMEGYAFDVGVRQLVAHRARPSLRPVFPYWFVSERTSGFACGREQSPTRAEAALRAERDVLNFTELQWTRMIRRALKARSELPRIPLLSQVLESK